jgi:chemotaxis receptor (MCP) glutamine deamidase CheD
MPDRTITVAPDNFEVISEDRTLRAQLDSTIAVCLYDAVEEGGALLHLRFIARGDKRVDVTDTTLAADLMLLDRCVSTLRLAAPRAQNLMGRIAASWSGDAVAPFSARSVLQVVQQYLADAKVEIVSEDVRGGGLRELSFRPALGQLSVG